MNVVDVPLLLVYMKCGKCGIIIKDCMNVVDVPLLLVYVNVINVV